MFKIVVDHKHSVVIRLVATVAAVSHLFNEVLFNNYYLFRPNGLLTQSPRGIIVFNLVKWGSQAGVVDINHAFHLYYKCCMWIEFQSISTRLRGFLPGTPVSSLLKIDS